MSTSESTQPTDRQPLEVIAEAPHAEKPVKLAQRIYTTYFKLISASWLLSAILHLLALFVIGRVFLPLLPAPPIQELVMGAATEPVETLDEFQEISIEVDAMAAVESSALPVDTHVTIEEPELPLPTKLPVLASAEPVITMADTIVDVAAPSAASTSSAVSARTGMKASELRHAGGNAGSEAAVKESLVWLVKHQLPDGGWSLQHGQLAGCNCRDSGFTKDKPAGAATMYESRFGATGLALLPFLGSGRTHQKGEYQQVVKAGLAYLVNNMKREGTRASLWDRGNFYSHGICTIVLCEAYAMTKDPALAEPAQALINEIVYAQDPVGGGWRYTPRQPGDTSVTGWQFMALKSAKMGGLNVPLSVVEGANAFLDAASLYDGAFASCDCVIAEITPGEVVVSIPPLVDQETKTVTEPARQVTYNGLNTSQVQLRVGQPLAQGAPIAPYAGNEPDMNGWQYRYAVVPKLSPDTETVEPYHPTPTLTAVGMLCRMYYGWEAANPLLRRTADYLSELGPSVSSDSKVQGPNMYYNYYATQVLRHQSSAEQWAAWNESMRDFLIESQEVSGHERGSWYFGDHAHGDTHGGRLYTTALASMILEVYYRHLPLYRKEVTASFLE